jgi:hypothetical protein
MPPKPELSPPVRNRYFYGKMLDAYHFELETNYFNAKRSLINRMVHGYGVLCGIDVLAGKPSYSVMLAPGVAIDRWGREVVVPKQAGPYVIPDDVLQRARELAASRDASKPAPASARGQSPPRKGGGSNPPNSQPTYLYVQVLLCYHECETDPVPVLTGDCAQGSCAPGAIVEQFRVEFREGAAPGYPAKCHLSDLILGDSIDYAGLVRHVSRGCHEVPRSPCIVLANIRITDGDACPCKEEDIDITVRRIVYTNDLLFELEQALAQSERGKDNNDDDSEK